MSPDIIEEIEQNQYTLNVQASEDLIFDTRNYGDLMHEVHKLLGMIENENDFCETRHKDLCLEKVPSTKTY